MQLNKFKMKTKLLFLVVVLLLSSYAKAINFIANGIAYTTTSSTAIVTSGPNYSGAVTIPSTVSFNSKTYTVTSIGDNAFQFCSSLRVITIPNSVTSFGDYAFYNCTSLSVVNIGNTLQSIGNYAFYRCTSLSVITIPNSVTSIGNSVFYDCISLSTITIPNSVTSIDNYTFSGCTSLSAFTIPKSVTSIGNSAFRSCTSLSAITFPISVTNIGSAAFSGCNSLTEITIPTSVITIGSSAFRSCTSLISITVSTTHPDYCSIDGVLFNKAKTILITYPAGKAATSYTIPNSVKNIGNVAFSDCASLSSITIPNSVTSIGAEAFSDCTSLNNVTIPNSVTSISVEPFKSCKSLSTIIVDTANLNFSSLDGVLFDKTKATLITYPVGKTTKNYAIPFTVSIIESSAFKSCLSLTSITIPNSVTYIYGSAFSGCTGLSEIHVNITQPLNLQSFVFTNVNKTTCNLYVPKGSKAAYQVAEQWMDFINIWEEDAPNRLTTVKPNELDLSVKNGQVLLSRLPQNEILCVVDMKGKFIINMLVNSEYLTINLPHKGVYIVRVGKKSSKISN